jgi:hypothetical protein
LKRGGALLGEGAIAAAGVAVLVISVLLFP